MKRLYKIVISFITYSVIFLFIGAIIFIFYRSFPIDFSIKEILAPLVGSLLVSFVATFISAIFGIFSAIYLGIYLDKNRREFFEKYIDILANIPSIIIGLFGFILIIIFHKIFPQVRGSLIFAAISLAILILPYIVKLSLSGILNIPKEYIYLALSLGAKERDLIFKIYLRYSKGYIIKSLFLAYARAIEDTAVIMLTGAVASYGIVGSFFEPFEALSYKIYFLLSIDGNIENSKVYMLASILILIGTILVYISNKKGDLFDRVSRF